MSKNNPNKTQVGGKHYLDFEIHPGEFCERNGLDHYESSVIKRMCRHQSKDKVQDLEKAIDEIIKIAWIKYGVDLSPSPTVVPSLTEEELKGLDLKPGKIYSNNWWQSPEIEEIKGKYPFQFDNDPNVQSVRLEEKYQGDNEIKGTWMGGSGRATKAGPQPTQYKYHTVVDAGGPVLKGERKYGPPSYNPCKECEE